MTDSIHDNQACPKGKKSGKKGLIVWLYGLSGAGKTTLARLLEADLLERGLLSCVIDGDHLRGGLNSDLGYTMKDRKENVRRAAEVAKILSDAGIITIAALITPTRELRQFAKDIVGEDRFLEVYLRCSFQCAATRDVKGLYAKVAAGSISHFTGNDSPFEPPSCIGVLVLDTENVPLDICSNRLSKTVNDLLIHG